MIDRQTFVDLNRHMGGIEAFKLRQRRGQIPLLDHDQRRGRGFYLVEAYLSLLVDEFHSAFAGMSLTLASNIVSDAIPGLRERWADIADAAHPGRGGIMIGRAMLPMQKPVPFVASPLEATDTIAAATVFGDGTADDLVSIVSVSASRTLAVFVARCHRAGVELPADGNLWAEVA